MLVGLGSQGLGSNTPATGVGTPWASIGGKALRVETPTKILRVLNKALVVRPSNV